MLRTLVTNFVGSFDNNRWNPGTPGKNYDYLYLGEKDAAPGDHALVHNGTHFGIVEIVRVKPGISDKVTKTVIDVVTKEEFERYSQANGQIHEYRKVFDQLDHMIAEEDRMNKYRDLAARNPDAAKLMEQVDLFQKGAILDNALPAPSAAEATREPIPEGVMWDGIKGIFVNKNGEVARDISRSSSQFVTKWYDRRHEFPTPSTQAK